MSDTIKAIAVYEAKGDFKDFEYEPIVLKDDEVHVTIRCCGVCHSDLHQKDNDWGIAKYPLVPGHEIIGIVKEVGANVTELKVGDRVGIGPQTGNCGDCRECDRKQEQFCPKKAKSYNSPTGDEKQPMTYGGFAEAIRVKAKWAFKIPDELTDEEAAPMLCAGITTWTPMVTHGVGPGKTVGIVGVGGLGHVALQFAAKLGAHTVALSRSADKKDECLSMGASEFINTSEDLKEHNKRFDILVSTISADGVDWNHYLNLLRPDGVLCMVGLPNQVVFTPMPLVANRLTICGSYLASNQQVKDMLEFSAANNVKPLIELKPMTPEGADSAMQAIHDNKPRYRIVLVRDQEK